MAKIIYGVSGEGFGHSSRSQLVGKRLLEKGHDVIFAASQKSLVYLRHYFGQRVKEVYGLSFSYEKGYVDPVETVKKNIVGFVEGHRVNRRFFKGFVESFKPDLVISDFEPFTAWWAFRKRKPFISIDHEHMLTQCRLEHNWKKWFDRFTATVVTRFYYFGARRYLILNFFRVPTRGKSTLLVPPIIRSELAAMKASAGKHIVLYSTTGKGKAKLLELLSEFDSEKFYVYGFNEAAEYKNCILKERSTEGFLTDLASCRGVIASAGFSLISECLYFKKPMLLLPVAGQYEQIINTHYIGKLGLGIGAGKLDREVIKSFLEQIDKGPADDQRIIWPDNEEFFSILEEQMAQLGI